MVVSGSSSMDIDDSQPVCTSFRMLLKITKRQDQWTLKGGAQKSVLSMFSCAARVHTTDASLSESWCMKPISYLDSFVFPKFHQEKRFLEKGSCAFSKDTAYCLRGAGSWRLSGALAEKKEVLVLTEQAQSQASAAASSCKECPDAHGHHDHVR